MKKTAVTKVAEFLASNPGSTRAAIGKGTKLKGIQLTNVLKRLRKDGQLNEDYPAGEDATFTVKTGEAAVAPVEETTKEIEIPVEDEQLPPTKKGRDNTKYTFNGNTYAKGRLVQEVVRQYVAGNKGVTYKKLKEVFPDELLQRFGIFRTEEEARGLSSAGRDRFFMKEEDGIKLKDCTVYTCNQFTAGNIQPLLKAAKALGFKIK
jgi:hypothetical protein